MPYRRLQFEEITKHNMQQPNPLVEGVDDYLNRTDPTAAYRKSLGNFQGM